MVLLHLLCALASGGGLGHAGPQGLCPGAGGHQTQVATHILATSTRLGSAGSCAEAQQVSPGRSLQVPSPRSLYCLLEFSPAGALSAQPLCRVGWCWDKQKEVSPGMPECFKVSSPGVPRPPAALGGDEGTSTCPCAQGCCP